MDVFIYYFGCIVADRDAVEDALDESLSNLGGEVTGAGAGEAGGNFDLSFPSGADSIQIRDAIFKVLRSFHFPPDTKLTTAEDEWSLGSIRQD